VGEAVKERVGASWSEEQGGPVDVSRGGLGGGNPQEQGGGAEGSLSRPTTSQDVSARVQQNPVIGVGESVGGFRLVAVMQHSEAVEMLNQTTAGAASHPARLQEHVAGRGGAAGRAVSHGARGTPVDGALTLGGGDSVVFAAAQHTSPASSGRRDQGGVTPPGRRHGEAPSPPRGSGSSPSKVAHIFRLYSDPRARNPESCTSNPVGR